MKRKRTKHTRSYTAETEMIYGRDRSAHWDFRHHVVPPITASSAFRLENTRRGARAFEVYGQPGRDVFSEAPIYVYERLDEPTVGMLEEDLAMAEKGGFALCFSSGMAAISGALLALLQQGDHLIAHQTLYGCTYSLMTRWLPRLGVELGLVDLRDPTAWVKSVTDRTRVIYLETPSNPTLELIDLSALCERVKKLNKKRKPDQRIRVVVDNTFGTPYCQRPLEFGADVVVHSLTKNIGGFGTDMGGAVITHGDLDDVLRLARKDFGWVLSSRSAWTILVYGIATLKLRLSAQIANCYRVAEFLQQHPKVTNVRYPGLETFPQIDLARRQMRAPDGSFAPGTLIYFEVADGARACERFIDHVAEYAYTITLAVSLGQIRTLIETPGLMTHATIPPEMQQKSGIGPGSVRLSLGIENAADIIGDLQEALERV